MKRFLKIVFPLIGRAGIGKYIFLGLLSGVTSFLFINFITRVVAMLTVGSYTAVSQEYLITFIAVIFFYTWSRKALAFFSVKISQKVVWHLRKEILKLTLNANYQALSTRKNFIQASILSDVGALANASIGSIDFFIQIVMAIGCLIYLASISVMLFFLTLIVSSIGILVYSLSTKENMKNLVSARKVENGFHANLNAILNGFKEIFMDPNKGNYIYEEKVCKNADESSFYQVTAITGLINNQIIGQILSQLLITAVLLVFSVTLEIKASDIIGFIFTLMYLLGAISSVMSIFPSIMMAKVASNNLFDLKKELESIESLSDKASNENFSKIFQTIETKNLEFIYSPELGDFRIGPIDFKIIKGETIFIYGGNGSGKTTFIYSLLGLCIPTSGEIYINELAIDNSNYRSYRSLFSVVFNDFYLFEGIIGVETVDVHKWDKYLKLFELEGKVSLEDGHFSSTDLSTGQRKRLALIAALLEEKSILVLDEWAADQDPYFRKKFYTEIIPILNQDGFTIIAITHDDKYYGCAHKVYKMEEGNLILENLDFKPNLISNTSSIF